MTGQMRNVILIGLLVLIFAAALVCILLIPPAKPRARPWNLSNGSTVSLAGVTYGTNHVMPYGNKITAFLYPVLTPWLRQKLGAKDVSFNTPSNEIVVWFWEKNPKLRPFNLLGHFRMVAIDDYGLETDSFSLGSFATAQTSWHNEGLQGISLGGFPRRSHEFTIRIYANDSVSSFIGEFKVENRLPTNFPVWKASPLPITARTNGLQVSLSAFENGTKAAAANFNVAESGQPAANWTIGSIEASSATGETRHAALIMPDGLPLISYKASSKGRFFTAAFEGAFWHEEPAWKMRVELVRSANFPRQELWTVKAVPIPPEGAEPQSDFTTNIYGSEIGFTVRVRNKTSSSGTTMPVPVALHVRSPFPALDAHAVLLQVKDENGKNVPFDPRGTEFSTGGRGATIREIDEAYELRHAGTAKTLDVTLAYSKSLFVEFLARPSLTNTNVPAEKPR
jgi:hypothetical protein